MEPSYKIRICNDQVNEKLIGTSNLISDLMWKSISTSILNPIYYSLKDSVENSIGSSIWHSIQKSSKILIHNLNAKCSYTMGSKEQNNKSTL
jgi:hypothetical protein